MRIFCVLLCLSWFVSSCSDEESSSSQFFIVNHANGQGNISLYDYPSGKLTEHFFTISASSQVTAAAKDGDHIYLHTDYYNSKLRKIGLAEGIEEKATSTWIYYKPYIDTHNGNIILSYAEQVSGNVFRSYVKIYDETLNLTDSITDANVMELRSIKVANDRLFSGQVVANTGYFIRVLDLKTRTYIASIPVPSFRQFVYLSESQLLVMTSTDYFILDTESLQSSTPINFSAGNEQVTYDSRNHVLYFLYPNAQPALVQYTLYKVDVSTGEKSLVTQFGESIVGPIVYDDKSNVIVSGGGVKIFSTKGEVLKKVALPYSALHIFIK
jgi:hypothetical protein